MPLLLLRCLLLLLMLLLLPDVLQVPDSSSLVVAGSIPDQNELHSWR